MHSATCKWAHFPSAPCHSLPTATEDCRDFILLIISSVVNSGGRIQSIQLTAWQLFWLSCVTLAKTYFCQFTKKISLGEGIHMVTFSNWLLKNTLRIFGKMPVLKTELKISTENSFSAYTIQVLQVNLSMKLLKKCLQDQKKKKKSKSCHSKHASRQSSLFSNSKGDRSRKSRKTCRE